MTNKFRNYFHYSASERNGLIVLLVLIILAVTGVFLRDYFTDDSESFKAMDLHALLEQANGTESKNDNLPTVLQEFDPNKLDQTGWINLGFSEKQAASIIKYRDKAGDFKNPEDLLKKRIKRLLLSAHAETNQTAVRKLLKLKQLHSIHRDPERTL